MKKILTLLSMLALIGQAQAQVAWSGALTGSGATLKSAFDAINVGGTSGAVTVTISANTTEAASAVLNQTGYTVTITNSATATVSGSIAGALVDFNGADNVTVNGGSGVGGTLTFDNTNTAGFAVRLTNDAMGNAFNNCTFKGVNSVSPGGVFRIEALSSHVTGNDNNTINTCKILSGGSLAANGIYSVGTTLIVNDGVTVTACEFADIFSLAFSSASLFVGAGNAAWTITNNSVYQTATRTPTAGATHYGIQVAAPQVGINFNVTGNSVGGSAAGATGTWSILNGAAITNRFVGILMTAANGVTGTSNVKSNIIRGITLGTSSGPTTAPFVFSGIYVSTGFVDVGGASASDGNTIGSTSANGSISVTGSTAGVGACGIAIGSSDNTNTKNNTVAGITVAGSTTSIPISVFGIFYTGATNATSSTISNNTIGSALSNSIFSSTACTVNTVTASATTPQPALGQSAVGIVTTAATPVTISNNTIKNVTNAFNSITTPTAGLIYLAGGIYNSGVSSNLTIQDNTISDIKHTGSGAALASASVVAGIRLSFGSADLSATPTATISGNTISALTSAQAASTSSSAAVQGITIRNVASGSTITNNTIFSLSSTNTAVATSAVGILCPANNTVTISRNLIYNVNSSASGVTTGTVIGIGITGGTITAHNNMIRLGTDISNDITIYGIHNAGGSTNNIHFNSIYIGGTSSGNAVLTAAISQFTSGTHLIQNNILVNNRNQSAAGATGLKNYALRVTSISANLASGLAANALNNNVYLANGTGGTLFFTSTGPTEYNTMSAWKTATAGNYDSGSGVGDPLFVAPTAATPDLKLQATSPLEGAGTPIAGITVDREGDTRNATTPDIGADEGTFTPASDIFSPSITFTAIPSPVIVTTDQTLTATITDAANPTAANARMWFKKSTDPSFTLSVAGTNTSGTTWTFTTNYAALSPAPANGDIIQYYVAADDATGNIGTKAYAVHTAIATAPTTAPTTPNAYTIVAPLSTTLTVGTAGGENYPSLTKAGGLFAAINSAALGGNTTVTITSDLTEDGTNTLLPGGLGAYTLNITASAPRTISNSLDIATPSAMIKLDGADNVTFDGTSAKYLTFRNTHATPASTKPVFEFTNNAVTNTLTNCTVEFNGTSTSAGAVQITSGGTSNTLTVSNSKIRDAVSGTTGVYANGINISTATGTVLTASNNEIFNFTNNGIRTASGVNISGSTISGNSFYNNFATKPSLTQSCIVLSAGNNFTITNNYFGGGAVNCGGSTWENTGNVTWIGIDITGAAGTASTITGNTWQNILMSNTGGSGTFYALRTSSNQSLNFSNNLIGHATTAGSITTASTGNQWALSLVTGDVTLDNNTIANFRQSSTGAASAFRGVASSGSGSFIFTRNKIFNCGPTNSSTQSSSAFPVTALDLGNTGATAKTITIANNFISLGDGISNNHTYYGIFDASGTGYTSTLHYNSIYIGGTATGANKSYAYARQATSAFTGRNNIFHGTRSFAVGATASGISAMSGLNYNLLVGSATSKIGENTSTPTAYDFAGWKTATGGDANSWSEVSATVTAANLFTDAANGDLNINTANPEAWYVNGKGVQVSGQTNDYGATSVRSTTVAGGSTDIGADEMTPSSAPPSATASPASPAVGTQTFTFGGRTIASIVWNSGTLPSAVDAKYYSGVNPPNPSNNSPLTLNAYWSITATGGSGYDYGATLNYDDALLGTVTTEATMLLSKTNATLTSWSSYAATVNTTANTIAVAGGLTSFSNFSGSGNIALPIEFQSISAQAKGSMNVINFTTATEKDVKEFAIERSLDNRTWEVIGTKAAIGGTTTTNYSFNDVNPTTLAYYRVRSVETNGKDQISKIVAVKRNGGKLAVNMVSPVPTTEGINVDFSTSKVGTLNVVITDIVGKVVKTERFTTVEGSNLMRLNLSNLAQGTYILSLNDGETVATQRIVKQ